MHIEFRFIWYDFWIGWYWNQKDKTLYICPFFCCCFKIQTNCWYLINWNNGNPKYIEPNLNWLKRSRIMNKILLLVLLLILLVSGEEKLKKFKNVEVPETTWIAKDKFIVYKVAIDTVTINVRQDTTYEHSLNKEEGIQYYRPYYPHINIQY